MIAFLAEAAYVHSLPLEDLVCSIPDDSFFYLRVAQEFWGARDFSFDGVNRTYGFQPLWQLIVIGISSLSVDSVFLFRAVLTLCCLLHVVAGSVLWRLLHSLGGRAAAVSAVLVWTLNPSILVWCWGLKENALYAVTWLLILSQVLAWRRGGPSRPAALVCGMLMGLAVLTRFNAVLVVGLGLVALALPAGSRESWKRRVGLAGLAAVVCAVAAAPWYVFASVHFGVAMPTSGVWKTMLTRAGVEQQRGWSWLGFDHVAHAVAELPSYLRFLLSSGYGVFETGLLVVAGLGSSALLLGSRLAPGWVSVLLLSGLAALISATANMLWLEPWMRYADWYAVCEFVFVPVAAGIMTGLLFARCRSLSAKGIASAVLVASILLFQGAENPRSRLRRGELEAPPRQMQLMEMGVWLRENLPGDVAVGFWDPGIVSFFRGGKTVSFDPLMTDLGFQQRLVADPFGFPKQYAEEQRVAYMGGASVTEQPLLHPGLPTPPGSSVPAHELLWMPFPDFDLGWSERRWMQLVRPTTTSEPALLDEGKFRFGVLYPADPQRRRIVTVDRDALLRGLEFDADAVRLQLQLPATGTANLLVDEMPVRSYAAADNGWKFVNGRPWRGRRIRLALVEAEASAVPQAQIVRCGL